MPNKYRASTIKPDRKHRTGTVYLLHFAQPYKHCRHYVGFTEREIDIRLGEHWTGNGSALTAAVHAQAGNEIVLARTWEGIDASVEFIIKSRAESPKLCPICNPDALKFAATYQEAHG